MSTEVDETGTTAGSGAAGSGAAGSGAAGSGAAGTGAAGTAALVSLRDRVQAVHEAVAEVGSDGAGPASAGRVRDAAGRLAALLGSLAPVLDPDATAGPRRALEALASTADDVVVADAGRGLADQMLAAVPRSLVVGPVPDRLRHHQRERARTAADALAAAVDASGDVLADVDRLVITPPLTDAAGGKPAKVLARCAGADDDQLAAAVGAARELGAGAGPAVTEPWLDVRGAALALAGSATAASSEHGKKARRLAAAADEVVAAVDEVTDTVRLQRLLVDLADVAHRHREPGFTYGLLHAQASTRHELARARLDVALDEVERDKLRSWLPGR